MPHSAANSAGPDRASGPWTMEGPPGAETVVNGRRVLYFAGTGYLGLQSHPALVAAARDALARYGIHTATSRSGYGTCPPVREVERRAAELLGVEDAVYLVSGYAGNTVVTAALAGTIDCALIDEHAHESLYEAVRNLASPAQPPVVFRHRDVEHLGELLAQRASAGQRPLVLTDGLFAVSGHLAPLAEYLEVLKRYPGAALLVDDAHGLGVLGASGRGSLELAGLPPEIVNRAIDETTTGPRVYHTATLSKAIGGHGGVVAGSRRFLDRVRSASGWFRGSSAPAAPVAAATAKGLELTITTPSQRESLAKNVLQLRRALANMGLPIESSPAPIVGLRLTSAGAMQQVHRRLAESDILIGYTRDYAGAGPDGMLRIAVFATHTPEMIERLIAALRMAIDEVH
ncbi:MAG: pyridoxal phosphate-dependent aminotransferase family protein [Pirellulales bacterium]